jgi:hypothetical protein
MTTTNVALEINPAATEAAPNTIPEVTPNVWLTVMGNRRLPSRKISITVSIISNSIKIGKATPNALGQAGTVAYGDGVRNTFDFITDVAQWQEKAGYKQTKKRKTFFLTQKYSYAIIKT